MRANLCMVAAAALLTTGFGQRPPQRPLRAEMVVTGIVGRTSPGGFSLKTQAGNYNVQVTRDTIINAPSRVISSGARVTVQGFPARNSIRATRIKVLTRVITAARKGGLRPH